MTETPAGRGTPSLLLAVAAFVIVVAGMRAAEAIIVPLLLSVFLAVISAPALLWMEARGLPKALALLFVVAGVVGLVVLMVVIIGSSIDDFTRNLPAYQASVQQLLSAAVNWVDGLGLAVTQEQALRFVNPDVVFRLTANALNGLGGALGNAFLVFLTVLFILHEAGTFPLKLRVMRGEDDESLARMQKVATNVRRYLAVKTGTSLATGVTVAVWLAILHVDFPVLWGLVAFLFNFVPNIGSIIAALPAILIALIQHGPATTLWVVAGYVVINSVIGNLVEPRLFGRSLGLSALVVFISLVFWGWVLGPVGMFLSVPLTMTFKIAMESDPRTRPVAILLGSEADALAALPKPADSKDDA
jgi:AI-2 transport protein TqsA